MRNFKQGTIGAPLSLAALLAISSCGHSEQTPPTQFSSLEPASVVVEQLQPATRRETYEAVGTMRARNSAAVASKIVSYIRRVHVETGDSVKKGQLLVELDDQDLVSNLEQAEAGKAEAEQAIAEASHALVSAEAQLDLAQATHRRFSDLLEKESVSRQEYDEVEAKRRSAEAAVAMTQARRRQAEAKKAQAEARISAAKVSLGYSKIHAPFSGVVTERRLDPGALAAPGAPILMIDQGGRYRLEAAVPESRLGAIRRGQTVSVRFEALQETLRGRVTEIVPQVDPDSRTFTVKIALPQHPSLRTGLFGRAVFPAGERTLMTVPTEAVTKRGQLDSVFVVEEQTARRRLVSLGSLTDGRYEVLSGLRLGERVVLKPGSLIDGQPVRIQRTGRPSADRSAATGSAGPAAQDRGR